MARTKGAGSRRDAPESDLERLQLQVGKDPEDVEALYAWFDALAAQAGSQTALAALRSLAARPRASSPSLVLGYCLFGLGRSREGVVAFERAHRRRPREPTLYGYACALLVSGNPKEALALLKAADRRGRLTARPLVCLANTYLALGKPRLAEGTLRRVTTRGARDWQELVDSARARVQRDLKRTPRASAAGGHRREARARPAKGASVWLRPAPDGGLLLRVHAQPGSDASRLGAVDPWRAALVVRVRARPKDGEANEELCRVVAAALGQPQASVSIVGGSRSREKVLRVVGVDEARARRALEGGR